MFMKRVALLMALNVVGGTAWAADLPLKAPAVTAYDWTGFYLGGNLGATNGTSSFSDNVGGGAKHLFVKQPGFLSWRRSVRRKL
jgi:hypothetical protein